MFRFRRIQRKQRILSDRTKLLLKLARCVKHFQMKNTSPSIRFVVALSFLFAGVAHAATVGFIKNSALYVITAIDKGNTVERKIDNAVGQFSMDGSAVCYLKGSSLYLVRDMEAATLNPEKIDTAVSSVKISGNTIAYVKGNALYVRRVDEVNFGGRRVDSGVMQFEVESNTVLYLKNMTTLYRVTNIDTGANERVAYPVGEFQLEE